MITLIVTLCLLPILACDHWPAREASEAILSVLGDWDALSNALRESTDPEQRDRLSRARARLAVSRVRAMWLAAGEPDAKDLGWPELNDDGYSKKDWPTQFWSFNFQEDYANQLIDPETGEYGTQDYPEWLKMLKARALAGLTMYVIHTGNWGRVERELKWKR